MSQSGPPAEAKQAQAAAMAELESAQRRKRAIDGTLANLEASIWAFEGSYLDETAASGGNIIKGFDNYLKPPGTQKQKKADTSEVDRLFSTSSVTFQQNLTERHIQLLAPSVTTCLKPMTTLVADFQFPESTQRSAYASSSTSAYFPPPSAVAGPSSATSSLSYSKGLDLDRHNSMPPPPLPPSAVQRLNSLPAASSSMGYGNADRQPNLFIPPPMNMHVNSPTSPGISTNDGGSSQGPRARTHTPMKASGSGSGSFPNGSYSDGHAATTGISTDGTTRAPNANPAGTPATTPVAASFPLFLTEEQTQSIAANIAHYSNEELQTLCSQLAAQGFEIPRFVAPPTGGGSGSGCGSGSHPVATAGAAGSSNGNGDMAMDVDPVNAPGAGRIGPGPSNASGIPLAAGGVSVGSAQSNSASHGPKPGLAAPANVATRGISPLDGPNPAASGAPSAAPSGEAIRQMRQLLAESVAGRTAPLGPPAGGSLPAPVHGPSISALSGPTPDGMAMPELARVDQALRAVGDASPLSPISVPSVPGMPSPLAGQQADMFAAPGHPGAAAAFALPQPAPPTAKPRGRAPKQKRAVAFVDDANGDAVRKSSRRRA